MFTVYWRIYQRNKFPSVIMLVKMTHHYFFCFVLIFFFHGNSLGIYRGNIFVGKIPRKFTDGNIPSAFPFVFIDFLVVTSRILKGGNIRNKILAIKTKFPCWIPTLKVSVKTPIERAWRFRIYEGILTLRLCFYYPILFIWCWTIIFNLSLF